MTSEAESPPLTFGELVDLEVGLRQDADAPRELLEADAARVREQPLPSGRRALLRAWVESTRARRDYGTLGATWEHGIAAASALLFVGMTAAGWGVGAGLFHYTGEHPVNVLTVLVILVGAQVALLLLTLISLMVLRISPNAYEGIPLLDMLRALVRNLGGVLARAFAQRSPARASALRQAMGYARSRHGLYGHVERLMILRSLQLAAVGFNLGALSNLLFTVSVSDLAFSWATTLSWTPEGLARVLATAATPWSWAWPAACPDEALLRATQYSRLDAAFEGAGLGSRGGLGAGAGGPSWPCAWRSTRSSRGCSCCWAASWRCAVRSRACRSTPPRSRSWSAACAGPWCSARAPRTRPTPGPRCGRRARAGAHRHARRGARRVRALA
jgi:hypothetical protein